jgi:hypothetical protein
MRYFYGALFKPLQKDYLLDGLISLPLRRAMGGPLMVGSLLRMSSIWDTSVWNIGYGVHKLPLSSDEG